MKWLYLPLSVFPSSVRSWPPLGAADAHVPYISRVILHTGFGVRALVYIQYGFFGIKLLSLRSDLFWGIILTLKSLKEAGTLLGAYGARCISDIYSCLSFSPSASEFIRAVWRFLDQISCSDPSHLINSLPDCLFKFVLQEPNRPCRSIKRRRANGDPSQ